MSLREEMVASIEAVTDADKRTTDSAAYDLAYSRSFDFLRDHGQALLEAVVNAERYREALQNIADLAGSGCALESIAEVALHPAARSNTVDGGGV